MDKQILMMKDGKISTTLIKFGIPSIIGFLVNALYNFVDAVFVGGIGTEAMAAASVVFPIAMVMVGVGHTFGSGGASYVSRLIGASKKTEAEATASTSIISAIITGIIVTVLSVIFIEPILRVFGATDSIMSYAKDYSYIYLSFSLFPILGVTLNNLARSEGALKVSMMAMIAGAALNIALDPIFIYSLNMGIKGAALATVISQALTVIILTVFYRSRKSFLSPGIKKIKFSKKIYSEVLKIGIPTFLYQLLTSISMGMLNNAAANYGDEAVAAMGIITRILAIGSFVIFGYSKGFQPFAGYNYGSGNISRLKKGLNFSLIFTTIIGVVLTFVQIMFSHQIVSIFTKNPQVIEIASRGLIASSIMFSLLGFQVMYATLFLALGMARQGSILSLARQGICFIPVILILPAVLGLDGVIFTQMIADALTVLLTLIFAIKVNSKLREVELSPKVATASVSK